MNSPLPKRARNFQENIPPMQKESSIFTRRFCQKSPAVNFLSNLAIGPIRFRFCQMKMNFKKHPVHKYDSSMSHPAMNESLKFSERPSVIFSYPKPKISTPDASTAEDSETDLSEDEVELTNEMLLDLKNSFNTIKESFNNGNVIGQKTDQSDGVPLDEAIVVNSANLETKSVTIGDAVGINGVSNDNVTNDDVTKEDVTKDDVIKEDVTKISTQNAQSETKRTKTSQKRPSKSNIQFQVPKKLQVLHQNTQTTAHWYNFDGLPHKNHYVTNPTCIGVTNIGGHT